eukprot:TRINITY_DN5285_c0_g1_i2.p1 TRINITY_DN5285_c0_g1~~TRINITY_DN5285_c0_g1_i2.p1  ORF type:complete len:200 (-),score=28.12 TRINITY_DN5285_c0_g1_i2:126-689(-)
MAEDGKDMEYQIGIVGDTETGKTSLVVKYCENKFDDDYIMTIGANHEEKSIPLGPNQMVLSVWDLGGQTDNLHMVPLVANDAAALVFVFDLTRKQTLLGVKEWYKLARECNNDAPVFLVGTKYDLFCESDSENVQSVTKLTKKFAEAMKAPLIFVSAKNSTNVSELFTGTVFLLLLFVSLFKKPLFQ